MKRKRRAMKKRKKKPTGIMRLIWDELDKIQPNLYALLTDKGIDDSLAEEIHLHVVNYKIAIVQILDDHLEDEITKCEGIAYRFGKRLEEESERFMLKLKGEL